MPHKTTRKVTLELSPEIIHVIEEIESLQGDNKTEGVLETLLGLGALLYSQIKIEYEK